MQLLKSVITKSASETLPQFLARVPPSSTTSDAGSWIGVSKSSMWEEEEYHCGESVKQSFSMFCSAVRMAEDNERQEKKITMQTLSKSVFEKQGAVGGKWLFNIDREEVDDTWENICRSLFDDIFEDRAQVTTADPLSFQHCIALSTTDYTDTRLQERFVKGIRSAGVSGMLRLKPLAASSLELYPGTYPWSERSTSLFYVLDEQTSILTLPEYSKRKIIRNDFSQVSGLL